MKKLILPLLAVALVAGLTASPAFAKGGKGKAHATPEAKFAKLDADKDGKVTLAEFKAAHTKHADKAEAKFKKIDANNDGSITLDELKSYAAAHHHKHGKKK